MQKYYKKIENISKILFKDLREIRRYLHKHPELGRQEYKTSKFLKDKITEFGKFKITMVGETGFTADLIQSDNYPWIAVRGDMDALPINDEKKVSYKSINKNCCHACGHDFHSTVVLGVANILYQLKDSFKGNIRFIFQHAEEPIPGGALDFVNQNMLDKIECIFGFHADPKLRTNTIGVLPGWNTAQSIQWKINIRGKGGHSSRPQNAVDPIFIGISVINELYSGLYRILDTNNPFVFTVGKIQAGDSYNVIPDLFNAEGTLRVTNNENKAKLLNYMNKTLKVISDKWEASSEVVFTEGAPSVNNDMDKTEQVKKYIYEIINTSQMVFIERSMGGEDFGHYQTVIPGVFIRVGVGANKVNPPLHNSKFDIDEQAIPFAVNIMSYIAMRYFTKSDKFN